MGYDLHITRADDWLESEKHPISIDQWREYIERDPEMAVDEMNKQDENDLTGVWYGKNGIPGESEIKDGFWWYEGRIMTKNPDRDSIRKMTQIAATFDARVVGEEDEEYRSNGETWEEKYIDKPPGLFKRLQAWWTGTSLPERKTDWVMTGRWD